MLSPISTNLSLCFLCTKTQTSTPQTALCILLFRLRFSGSTSADITTYHLPQAGGPRRLQELTMYISLMVHARSLSAKPESHNTQEVLWSGLRNSLKRASLKILSYLLDNGADVSIVDPGLFYPFYFSSYGKNNII